MSIKLDKILTMSAKDYCEMHGKKLYEYEARFIHYAFSSEYGDVYKFKENFKNRVPKGTEVIVDYRFSIGGAGDLHTTSFGYYASGTALIPKNIQKDKSKGK
jgi:hypothetical protein